MRLVHGDLGAVTRGHQDAIRGCHVTRVEQQQVSD